MKFLRLKVEVLQCSPKTGFALKSSGSARLHLKAHCIKFRFRSYRMHVTCLHGIYSLFFEKHNSQDFLMTINMRNCLYL